MAKNKGSTKSKPKSSSNSKGKGVYKPKMAITAHLKIGKRT
jgi:hypothetical protein